MELWFSKAYFELFFEGAKSLAWATLDLQTVQVDRNITKKYFFLGNFVISLIRRKMLLMRDILKLRELR